MYGVKYRLYADDTQLYASLHTANDADVSASLEKVEHCIADIRIWMTSNVLKCNEDNNNIIYMVSPYYSRSLKHLIYKLMNPLSVLLI